MGFDDAPRMSRQELGVAKLRVVKMKKEARSPESGHIKDTYELKEGSTRTTTRRLKNDRHYTGKRRRDDVLKRWSLPQNFFGSIPVPSIPSRVPPSPHDDVFDASL